jgi:predicted nucleic acid-binding protein
VKFLLDTNVVSEWTRPQPNPQVMSWLHETDEDRIYLSVVTLAELRHGIERLVGGRRRSRLETWLEDELTERFSGRIVNIDSAIADTWGTLVATREKAGRPIGAMDAMLAATAISQGQTLVTRSGSDFALLSLTIFDPWTEQSPA